jgi:hypothetical protein
MFDDDTQTRLLSISTFNIRVTTGALRCIDKAGGLDNYLLYTRDKTIGSQLGTEMKSLLKARFLALTGAHFAVALSR